MAAGDLLVLRALTAVVVQPAVILGMAFSDIFGTNLFDLALIFVIDAFYAGQPVLPEMGDFSMLAALLGAAVTLVYVIGLIERRDGALPRVGFDSLAVAILYLGGLVLMYRPLARVVAAGQHSGGRGARARRRCGRMISAPACSREERRSGWRPICSIGASRCSSGRSRCFTCGSRRCSS